MHLGTSSSAAPRPDASAPADREPLERRPRVALVTGAGRGLGAAIATALAADGCAVAVNDLPESSGAAAVVDAVQAAGGEAILAPGDVTTPEGVGAAVAAAEDAFGPIDVLVPCATGPQPEAAVEHMTWEDLLLPLRFFTLSPLLLVQAVLPGMRAAGGGRVVIIGSDLAQRTDVGWSAYSAAKAAQLALVRTWARELAADGINVNAVAPDGSPSSATRRRRPSTSRPIPRACRSAAWGRPQMSRAPWCGSPPRPRRSSPASR